MITSSTERAQQILSDFEKGKGYAEIGRIYGISRQRVYQIVKLSKNDPQELARIFLEVFARDDWKCQWTEWCHDFSPYKKIRTLKSDLVIHHIDSNPSNNSLENLITLCKKCHNHFHGQQRSSK